jgi:hypothetical protein
MPAGIICFFIGVPIIHDGTAHGLTVDEKYPAFHEKFDKIISFL